MDLFKIILSLNTSVCIFFFDSLHQIDFNQDQKHLDEYCDDHIKSLRIFTAVVVKIMTNVIVEWSASNYTTLVL
jgi:hypothetical protein